MPRETTCMICVCSVVAPAWFQCSTVCFVQVVISILTLAWPLDAAPGGASLTDWLTRSQMEKTAGKALLHRATTSIRTQELVVSIQINTVWFSDFIVEIMCLREGWSKEQWQHLIRQLIKQFKEIRKDEINTEMLCLEKRKKKTVYREPVFTFSGTFLLWFSLWHPESKSGSLMILCLFFFF